MDRSMMNIYTTLCVCFQLEQKKQRKAFEFRLLLLSFFALKVFFYVDAYVSRIRVYMYVSIYDDCCHVSVVLPCIALYVVICCTLLTVVD